MGDMGDLFNAHKAERKKKRAQNREMGAARLIQENISFTSNNVGAHLIVENRIDYWPGTGKWIVRKNGKTGRGIRTLLIEVGKTK